MRNIICALIIGCLCSGCIHTAIVPSWQPAEVAASGMKKVAILNFSGENGSSVSLALSDRLSQSDFYTVMSPLRLNTEIALASYESKEPASDHLNKKLVQLAQDREIDGLLMGEVIEYSCHDRIETVVKPRLVSWPRNTKDDSKSRVTNKKQSVREGTVTLAFSLIDVETGDTLTSRKVSHQFRQEINSDGTNSPTQEQVLEDLTERCLDDIAMMIVPHCSIDQIRLAKCDVWTKGRRDVQQGMRLAAQGNWSEAEIEWKHALNQNPKNHAALFNLAVNALHHQRFTEAEDLAMQALQVQHREVYAQGLITIRQMQRAYEESESQRENRVIPASSDLWD